MAMESVDVRLARLEGSYQQIDRRLGSIEDRLGRLEMKVDAQGNALGARIDELNRGLSARIDALSNRVHTMLYGIIVAILVPILIRIFFP
jgi:archaellum component FlaC